MNYFRRALLLMTCFSGAIFADSPLMPEPENLIVYNRILTKVNGKTISVIDLMKKMDFFLQKHYPDLAQSKVARFQFYSTQWREYLNQLIDQELMLADAIVLEVKVTDAEVREELLNRFGPNLMEVLDQIQLSYEEAKEMVHDEMIVQRMTWFRVHSKVLSQINSQDVKEAYREYCAKNPPLEKWDYEVLSIRSESQEIGQALAHQASLLLQEKKAIAALPDLLKEGDVKLADFSGDERTLSKAHLDVLRTLAVDAYSPPIAQTSRSEGATVYRIFHVKRHEKSDLPPFNQIADRLKDELLGEQARKENALYIARLRERMGYDEKQMMEVLPPDFQPFALK
ncbi:MAG: peptidyl-prolyl cis-trans isomerase [Verrucomicrobia bacterium]|nr:peptidyl-prolyl cis-trans isomerase [Verrucomicrobiota bacterium]